MAGEGRKEEAGSQKSKDDEGGSVRLAKNPYIIVRGYWRLDSASLYDVLGLVRLTKRTRNFSRGRHRDPFSESRKREIRISGSMSGV